MNWTPYLLRTNELADLAVKAGNTPFGAVLVSADGTILLEQGNIELTEHKCTGHAETQLAERASIQYSKEALADCTLVTSVEPCVMCSGTIYWAGIGHVVYGLSETDLLRLTQGNDINPTLNLGCRDVFASGQKDITVEGPFPELQETLLEIHRSYW